MGIQDPCGLQRRSSMHRDSTAPRTATKTTAAGRERPVCSSCCSLMQVMADAKALVESVFRQESGRIIATLIRLSGSFDRAEEAMQEAFASAVATWSERGVPTNPGAWI